MAYDKQKAHEYYINYVKKGLKKGRGKTKTAEEQAEADRKSTKGLNDEGKAAAKQIKAQLQAERKEAYEKLKAIMNEQIAQIKEQIKAIKKLKVEGEDIDLLETPSVETLKADIEKLRADTKAKKAEIKADYDEQYYQMLDELKADGDYKATKKRKKKK